jgi:hypothetical protein
MHHKCAGHANDTGDRRDVADEIEVKLFISSVRLKFEQFQLIVGDGVFVDRVAALNRLL